MRVSALAGSAKSRAPTILKSRRRRPAPFAVSMATSSNDVSILRRAGGAEARGVAPLHPLFPLTPLPLPLDRWPMQNDGCKVWIHLLGRK
ncbi:unnamed protein product [Pieris macdunnoughi]|uniref:Uncharacterized protein n=2 Tax=Pieris TaxID=7115 RepID=A0A9P0TLP8_PIEBR|nr:unnamed protein product [Pieris macdunnoughi]CAH4029610.1 unnamed protein product [Pieris brassicae]